MATLSVQKPALTGVAPNYQAVSAADKFAAVQGGKYMLHYKNGATAQATGGSPNKITDTTTPTPAAAAPAAGFADAVTQASPGMTSTSEFVSLIDNATRFIDGQGFVNIIHPGTLTTVTVAIFGPL